MDAKCSACGNLLRVHSINELHHCKQWKDEHRRSILAEAGERQRLEAELAVRP